jgi:hypothetical protein
MAENDTTRRRFVQVAGGTVVMGLAGCSSNSDDGSGGSDGGDMDDESMDNESMDDESMDNESMDDGDGMDDEMGMEPTDPADAPRATIDRFSEAAGMLHVRDSGNDLPGPDEPVDFDENFLTQGYGPDGDTVQYYDFDVQPTEPAPIYAFFYENGDPVEGQLNVVGVVPGDEGYNDFWQVTRVIVPDEYEANTITSASALMDTDYDTETTTTIKNCPIVPDRSTASMRHGDGTADLVEGWYEGEVVSYFLFEEASLEASGGAVPRSPIYVSFNANPGEDGGGPPSGFMTEAESAQTHNVVATLPGDDGYSPLWTVNIYDNGDFGSVSDLGSATDATLLASGAANVNCPVVSVE